MFLSSSPADDASTFFNEACGAFKARGQKSPGEQRAKIIFEELQDLIEILSCEPDFFFPAAAASRRLRAPARAYISLS
jgi:hypothetical protein